MDLQLPTLVIPAKRLYEDDTELESLSEGPSQTGNAPAPLVPVTLTPSPSKSVTPDDTDNEYVRLLDATGAHIGEIIPNCPWPLEKPNSILVEVPETTLIFPEALYDGFEAPAPSKSEVLAIDSLQRKLDDINSSPAPGQGKEEAEDFQEFVLEDFTVYVDSAITGLQMKPLQYLNAKQVGHSQYYFDGVLRAGDEKYFLQKIPFRELSVGNYGPENDSVNGQIWIRSKQNGYLGRELYYRLGQPSKCYARYFSNFLWISNFAKYFVDYLEQCYEAGKPVRIHDFREDFVKTTATRHQSSAFKGWFGAYGKWDFRVPVSANVDFLYKEACDILSPEAVRFHRVFQEILTFEEYEPVLPDSHKARSRSETVSESESEVPPTIVTPYIAHCFGHLPCGSVLQPLELNPEVESRRDQVADAVSLKLTRAATESRTPEVTVPTRLTSREKMLRSIKTGDTISIPRDPESLSKWARETAHGLLEEDERWYGLVQGVEEQKGRRSFSILWMYRPVDTICCVMKYPIENELFLSNHCTCSENIKIDEDDVLGVHSVSFWPTFEETAEFICRQAYDVTERRFTTYGEADRICICNKKYKARPLIDEFADRYCLGDAVLVREPRRGKQLKPFELVEINKVSREVTLRRLLHRSTFDEDCQVNEVVYTDQLVVRKFTVVERKCYVHVQMDDGEIPVPYNRDGVGNLYFMTHFWNGLECLPLEKEPTLNQPPAGERLIGLDLFCGVGNLGRGLEEGGAVDMRYTNDISDRAIHAYMANVDPSHVTPFLGSIDVLQERAIQGRFGAGVPEVGLVGFLAGGSPCPGFSRLTNDRTTPRQRKNQSLVAAFASMVDLYRPRYGILENVLGIVQSRKLKREDVFCQLICSLVGMGYQVQMLFLDAWSYGSCQSRSRVFLIFAAPGESLPHIPPPSHSHPPDIKNLGLGILANGEKMVMREFHEAYPFEFRSASAGTADLPDVYDTKTDYCVPFPDHVSGATVTPQIRSQIKAIPHHPPGMNFSLAYHSGIMGPSDRALFPAEGSLRTKKGAVGWARVRPNRLFSTVVTNQSITDYKIGPQLHWREERPLTLMEARRAQGFPDDEVLVGNVRDKWRAVGNSVAREVSLALGLAFREAIFAGKREEGEKKAPRVGARWTSPLKTASYPSPLSLNGFREGSDAKSDATLTNGESRMSTAVTIGGEDGGSSEVGLVKVPGPRRV